MSYSLNAPAFVNADGTTTQTSKAFLVDRCTKFSFQGSMTGSTTPIGVVQAQYTNDRPPPGLAWSLFVPTNWSNVTNGAASITQDGAFSVEPFDVAFTGIRLVYTLASGTGGTLNATVKGSGPN